MFYIDKEYFDAIENHGGLPLSIVNLNNEDNIRYFLDSIKGLMITGGGRFVFDPASGNDSSKSYDIKKQNPSRYDFDRFLIHEALERDLPLIGICRGCQMIAHVIGCALTNEINQNDNNNIIHQQLNIEQGDKPVHKVNIKADTKLFQIVKKECINTNSFHNQAIKSTVHPITPSAYSEDGYIEAIESTEHTFVLGLQFHPERMTDQDFSKRIFESFLKAAQNYK